MDLLLINPGGKGQVYGKLGPSLSGIEPPIWCGLLASFIRKKGFSVKIIDAEAMNLSPEDTVKQITLLNPLLTGIIVLGANPSASSTPKMTTVSNLLTILNNEAPDIKTILCGLHPSALPERTLREEKVNFVCEGEGYYTILHLLKQLRTHTCEKDYRIKGLWYKKDNEIFSNPPSQLIDNLDELPMAAWDLLPMEKYRAHNWHCFDDIDHREPYAIIYTSLGCPFNCTYCNIHAMYDGKSGIRFRNPKKVLEEIDYLVKNYKIRNLKILDELFVFKPERVEKICDLIIERAYDLNIWAYARVDTVNENILKKMKLAGINWLAYGFESASKNVRRGVAKKFEFESMKKAIELTKSAGIHIMGNFIFGLPEDDMETMRKTLDMAKEFNFEYVNFYVAMAYPGSKLYIESLKAGVRLPDQWHGYSQYAEETLPLPTKYLPASEVLRFRDNAFKEYFSNPDYLNMIKEKFGQKVVDHINEMLKREIHRKFI